MFEDWDLIVSSFLSQYGLRIRTKEFETVTWDEFKALIAGLSPETALGRVVAIRSETDKDIIKHYTKDQRRIYDDWRGREAKEMDGKTFGKEMADLEKMFAAMCGGD
ncbi:Gp15 family bacteriophage protein [Enterocloster aldenensis]|uniref:Gp15 family bacteriophage protein n=1 Tax=Enterocloster aldenensis TaxID=358742 RepID=UPI004025B516